MPPTVIIIRPVIHTFYDIYIVSKRYLVEVKIREATPQARWGFTLSDQVNQLVSASGADPGMGFMARLMALCSLPLLQAPCW